jgi:hypothetical protein
VVDGFGIGMLNLQSKRHERVGFDQHRKVWTESTDPHRRIRVKCNQPSAGQRKR